MVEREHIENFLRLNGIPTHSDDEVIRSALVGAKWHENDVEVALMVLRENIVDHSKQVTTLHRRLRSDRQLSPETISALLGVDVQFNRDNMQLQSLHFDDKPSSSWFRSVLMLLTVIVITVFLTTCLLYYFSVGPFYNVTGF